jgi:drug/metabolite transporter (DMT)-like permease
MTALRDKRSMGAISAAAMIGPTIGVWMSLLSIQYTKIGIAATLMATTPLWVIPLVMAIHGERPSWRAIAGTVMAVAGVGVL